MRVLDDRREAALHCMGIKLEEVARVKGIVIAGRALKDPEQARLFHTLRFDDINLFTYDHILRTVTEIIKQVSNV